MRNSMLGVRLPEEIDKRLSSLATETNRPKSFFVKEALSFFLHHYENIYKDIADYEKKKKAGSLISYSMEDIKKMYDLN